MNCKQCGAPLKDGSMFCAQCGEKVSAEQPGAYVPLRQPAAAPPRPQSPFEPAQRTADRVFPSQQRAAASPYAGSTQPFAPSYPPQQPYAAARNSDVIDWEHLQPRSSPKSANRLIWGAAVLIIAVVVMVWTLLIR